MTRGPLLALAAIAAAAIAPALALAQSAPAAAAPAAPPAAAAPPIRMGLWQGTTVTRLSGLNLPPEVAERLKAMGRPVPGAQPRTIETESCLTPERWKEMFARAQQRESCRIANLRQDTGGMSADISCQSSSGTARGRLEMVFASAEKVHGTMHMEASSPSQPQPIVMDITIDSAYRGADCKGVSPDTPKVILR